MEHLKELVSPKTLHWLSYVANILWIVLGGIFFGIFATMEINESRFDFRCGSNDDVELIRGKCYEQYEKQYHKLPVYWFVLLNFFFTTIVCVFYSQAVTSRVNELEAHIKNEEQQAEQRFRNPTQKMLFTAYCFQLAARFLLGIFFVVIQASLVYPHNFPSNFNCNLIRVDNFTNVTVIATSNVKQTQTSYECHNQRAAEKTFGCHFLIGVTGFFALLAFVEATLILFKLVRSRREERFMEDLQFYKYYLKSNSNASLSEPERQALCRTNNHQHQHQPSTSIAVYIERTKKHVQTVTDRPLSDLKSPFHRNPGEGFGTDITLDQIYTNLNIHEGRVDSEHLAGDRDTLLKNYPRTTANLRPRPADIFDANKLNILLVGHPGTGKTMFCTKILRDWASDKLFFEGQNKQLDFQVAFLVKLRMLNCLADQELNLRELLDRSENSAALSDENEVWDYIRQNPSKVLVIFDGFDEYSGRTEIDNDDILYRNPREEDRMPLHSLLKNILSGKILAGATVLTTTRPNALSCFGSLCFHRTVEILGFSTDQVEEYVEKFTNDGDKAETIKEHIRSNLILRSFSYIPVNCFIICSCLLKLLIDNSADHLGCLPTKLTEIYSFAIKIFYFCYDDDLFRHSKHKGRDFYLKPFKELPEAVTMVFSRLGEIAFNGIRQGRLVFESHEVKDLEKNGLFQRLPDTSSGFKEGKEQYCFLHLTVQEFFAAKHLVDTMSHEELKTFVSDHIEEGAWKVVIQFAAGLLEQEEQSTDIFSGLLPLSSVTREMSFEIGREELEARTETVTCWPASQEDKELVVTLFNCMYENNSSSLEVQRRLAQIDCNALDFSSCRLSPLECLTLVHALQSSGEKIVHFNLMSNDIGELGCIEISKLFGGKDHNKGFCNLKSLNFRENSITDEGVKHLTTALIITNCNLNSLGLEGNPITDKGVKHLTTALINSNCKLNSLNLAGNKITDKAVEHLTTALTHTNCKLNSLSLAGNEITDKAVEHLTGALTRTHCKLNSLSLADNQITDDGVKHLTKALINTNCNLNSLELYRNQINDKGVEHLTKALTNNNCKLNSLGLNDIGPITNKGVEHLTTALTHTNCKLKSLSLDITYTTDRHVEHLATALINNNCKLNSLSLHVTKTTDKFVEHLVTALINNNCKLNSLSLKSTHISDEFMERLATALENNNCKLHSLSLIGTDISDNFAEHFATALINNNCKLNSLSLVGTCIGDQFVQHLAAALMNNNCKLNSFSLNSTNIGGKFVEHLATALTKSNCKLKSLSLPAGAVFEKTKILINRSNGQTQFVVSFMG